MAKRQATSNVPAGFREVSQGFVLSKAGDVLIGKYLGAGKPKPMGKGAKKRMVKTYRIRSESGAECEIIGSSQVETFMGTVKVGQTVYIERLGQVEGGKGRVNTYRFAVKGK